MPAACVTEFCSWRTCGGGSIYGDQGCLKTQCKRESDCAPGEKCRPRTFNTTNCVKQQMGGCECTFGLSLNKKSFCLPSDTVTPCAECDGAALTCTKPGVPHEAAGFPLTIATATTCGGIKDFGTEELTVRCDTQELCSIVNCEKYTFDGSTLVTPSGLKCRVTPALP